jgi:hypothetical protein
MEIKKFESYQMNMDDGDAADEHAKEILSNYIERELDGVTLQDCFNELSLEEEQHQTIVKLALVNYLQDLLKEAMEIEIR